MGCTSGKMNQEYQKYQQMMQKLSTSYESIEQYIQSQRSSAFSYLANNGDVEVALENSSDRNQLSSYIYDTELFRKYKKINKYKYELALSKFIKNIKFCAQKMQMVSDMHSQFFEQLNSIRISGQGQAYIKKNEEELLRIQKLMSQLSLYLHMSKYLDDETKTFSDLMTMNSTTSASEIEFDMQKSK